MKLVSDLSDAVNRSQLSRLAFCRPAWDAAVGSHLVKVSLDHVHSDCLFLLLQASNGPDSDHRG